MLSWPAHIAPPNACMIVTKAFGSYCIYGWTEAISLFTNGFVSKSRRDIKKIVKSRLSCIQITGNLKYLENFKLQFGVWIWRERIFVVKKSDFLPNVLFNLIGIFGNPIWRLSYNRKFQLSGKFGFLSMTDKPDFTVHLSWMFGVDMCIVNLSPIIASTDVIFYLPTDLYQN